MLKKADTKLLILEGFIALIEGDSFTSTLRQWSTSSYFVHLGSSFWVMGVPRALDWGTSWVLSHHQVAAEQGVL